MSNVLHQIATMTALGKTPDEIANAIRRTAPRSRAAESSESSSSSSESSSESSASKRKTKDKASAELALARAALARAAIVTRHAAARERSARKVSPVLAKLGIDRAALDRQAAREDLEDIVKNAAADAVRFFARRDVGEHSARKQAKACGMDLVAYRSLVERGEALERKAG